MDNERLKQLDKMIENADHVETFLKSEAWPIIKSLVEAQMNAYKAECYDAARSTQTNLPNFLGRMESLEWFLNTVPFVFPESKKQAIAEKEAIREHERQEALLNTLAEEQVTGNLHHERSGLI